ncbi:MAG: PLP-dependent aminotransferase family protein [Desulfobacteraceae bacterium]
MDNIFADRITDVPRSFIREILKVALDKSVISFAGGLPNRDLFPVKELIESTSHVFGIYGSDIFQYSNSEGYIKLREYIASTYSKSGIDISPENILITNGAQQGLDLIGKILINEGDGLIIEEPGYLGALQAFTLYRPQYFPVSLHDDGMDLDQLKAALAGTNIKCIYTVPNFQNPSGITYSQQNREEISDITGNRDVFIIEDDPYKELRFSGDPIPSFKQYLPDRTILLGSFSKTVVPGFRIGWIAAPDAIFEKLLIAKQAADLHSCHFTQYIVYQFLENNDIGDHIKKIRDAYGNQCRSMLESIASYFPDNVTSTRPEGGMFLWATLPEGMAAIDLFNLAVKEKVIFVPGDPFYINKKNINTLRLNFSCVDPETIKIGIKRLGESIERLSGKEN